MEHIKKYGMVYINVPVEAYKQYMLENNNQDRIRKNLKMITSKFSRKNYLYEIKFTPIETQFSFSTEINNNFKYNTYGFFCESGNPYRLDLNEIISENHWTDNKHFNASFTLLNRADGKKYNEPTLLGELYEVFKRIMFLLVDFQTKNDNIIYVIGNTLDKRKNLLYEDFIGSFGDVGIKQGESSEFTKGNNSYYIKMK